MIKTPHTKKWEQKLKFSSKKKYNLVYIICQVILLSLRKIRQMDSFVLKDMIRYSSCFHVCAEDIEESTNRYCVIFTFKVS